MISLIAAAFVATTTPTPSTTREVRVEGIEARYVSTVDSKGVVTLSGYDRASGQRFEFKLLKDGTVRGRVGDRRISFSASDAD